ncbi:baseplate J/gp47 family protein [Arcobacter lanthieri]|uniref:baseplate J/gp47 family protein n=1 Tax=Aliarcobacter lanthieri TaxID=1355374 RepID=UPI0019232238|nr:baseplate J/gp47 family protein [Aliarcobacter lanthieri]MBL3520314.1 baseplate J/gp47 family protein [Aliarcobacter lanthieri]
MEINQNGFKADSFIEILTRLSNQLKDIYGQDINLEQDTPDGQMVGINTTIIDDLQSLGLYIYNSLDPDLAEGVNLDRLLKLLARTRLPATKSIVDIELTLSRDVTIPATYTVSDTNNQQWQIANSQTLEIGTHLVTFESVDYGTITAEPNTITQQVTILTEIDSLTNPTSAIPGRDEESDQQLRERRNKILEVNASSTMGSIVGKILTLDNVVDVCPYENKTKIDDEIIGVPANTYWLIVKGGEIDKIAEIIAKDKTGGTGLKGQVTSTYIENFVRQDGSIRQFIHEINFDRPIEKDIYLKFNVKRRVSTQSIDIENIKNTLANKSFYIAQNVTVTELYATVYSASSNFIATDLQVSRDNIDFVDNLLIAGYDEEFVIKQENIEITEIF